MSHEPTAATLTVELPGIGIGTELAAALGARGLDAQVAVEGDRCALHVRFADDEHVRLAAETTHAIESWLGDQAADLVVQHANGRCVVRPPGD